MKIKLAICIMLAVWVITLSEFYGPLWGDPVTVPEFAPIKSVSYRQSNELTMAPATIDYAEWNDWIAWRAPNKSGDWDIPQPDIVTDPIQYVDDMAPIHVKQWEPPDVPAYIEPQYYHPYTPRPPRRNASVPEPSSIMLLLVGLIALRIARRI